MLNSPDPSNRDRPILTAADMLAAVRGAIGEVDWAFGELDVGVSAAGYRGLSDARAWSPVTMLRLLQQTAANHASG